MQDRPRRSERLNKFTWAPSKVTKALLGSTGDLLVLPSSIQALPAIKLKDDPWEHKSNYTSLYDEHECLRAYHAKLDLMGSMEEQDQSDKERQVESIDDWELKGTKQGQKVFLKVTWFGGISNGYQWIY